MKRLYCLLALVCSIGISVHSLDIETEMGWDSARFDRDRTSSLASNEVFVPQGALFWSIDIKENVGENFRVRFGYDRGSVLRDRIETAFGVEYDIFSVFAGPFFAAFVSPEKPLGSGLTTELKLRIPGIFFVSLRNDTSLGSGLTLTGDFYQANSVLEAGFWVPNVIISGRVSLEEFIDKLNASDIANDRRLRYEFVANFFKKNVPYTIELRLGYQESSRSLSIAGVESADILYTLLAALKLSARVHRTTQIHLGGEFYPVSWTNGGMLPPAAATPLFSVSGGLTLSLPSLVGLSATTAD